MGGFVVGVFRSRVGAISSSLHFRHLRTCLQLMVEWVKLQHLEQHIGFGLSMSIEILWCWYHRFTELGREVPSMVTSTVPVGEGVLLLNFRKRLTSYAKMLLFSSSSLMSSEEIEGWTLKSKNLVEMESMPSLALTGMSRISLIVRRLAAVL